MTASPISPVSGLIGPFGPEASFGISAGPATSGISAFAHLLQNGVGHVNQKLVDAEALSKSFALDDSVPLQQVTFALQEARLSLEFMLQVRTRLVDAYQQFAQMQL
jgi:flagellar hook-basal body complex protein FliE